MADHRYRGYEPLTLDEIESMWDTAVFAFDTSALLDTYRYSTQTRLEFFDAIKSLGGRAWVPHQAMHEFNRNRNRVRNNARNATNKELGKAIQGLIDYVECARDLPVDTNNLRASLSQISDHAKGSVEQSTDDASTNPSGSDNIKETIHSLFSTTAGDSYETEVLVTHCKEAEWRFQINIPPGYIDKSKQMPDRWGDYIIWRQVLDKACSEKLPVIFITNDKKADWWEKENGKDPRPRPELRLEMWEEAQVDFHMYTSEQFMLCAKHRGLSQVSDTTVDELVERAEDEERLQQWTDQVRTSLGNFGNLSIPAGVLRNIARSDLAIADAFRSIQHITTPHAAAIEALQQQLPALDVDGLYTVAQAMQEQFAAIGFAQALTTWESQQATWQQIVRNSGAFGGTTGSDIPDDGDPE